MQKKNQLSNNFHLYVLSYKVHKDFSVKNISDRTETEVMTEYLMTELRIAWDRSA